MCKRGIAVRSFQYLVRVLWFYVGLTVMTMGYALMIKPALGAAPWDIFHLGVQGQTGIQLAFVVQAVGVGIILVNLLLGIRPTVGMVLNMLSVGPILQTILGVLPQPEILAVRWLMLLAGIFITGLGTALYVSADLGSGPRDGMMIGLTQKLNQPVGVVKTVIDIAVATTGWLLGGPLGLGTAVIALGLGPAIQFGMKAVARLGDLRFFSGFVRPVIVKKT